MLVSQVGLVLCAACNSMEQEVSPYRRAHRSCRTEKSVSHVCWQLCEQKQHTPVSTNLFVGISSKPISKKICLNSWRTLFRGCRAPAFCTAPRALKLYGLKSTVFHAPE